jgi:putative membrane protein
MVGEYMMEPTTEVPTPEHPVVQLPKPPAIAEDDRIFLAWQRSHMANERTFLAWSRTSVSLLAFGFVIERFDIFLRHLMQISGQSPHVPAHGSAIYLSLFSFFLAGFTILLSGTRFLRMRRHINKGEAVFSVLPDLLVVLSVVFIIIMAVVLSLPHLFEIGENMTSAIP